MAIGNINLKNDLGAPAVVAAVHIGAQKIGAIRDFTLGTGTKPLTGPELADYVMTLGGYVAAYFNWGGDFVKNIGVASLPLSAIRLYNRMQPATGVPITRSVGRVARIAGAGEEVPTGSGMRGSLG